MRIVFVENIYNTAKDDSGKKDHLFIHGGCDGYGDFVCEADKQGYEVLKYYKDMEFLSDDIILFCDRQLMHFYEGWKLLKSKGVLNRTIALMMESDVVDRKCSQRVLRKIKNAFPFFLTYQDDLVDNKKFFKAWPEISVNRGTIEKEKPWEELALATMISTRQIINESEGELYSERIKIADWFEEHPDYQFNLYGRNWEGYKNYRGIIKHKSEAYKNAKFAFCLENCRRNGYITEKIFDCFNNGIVPIYSGAPNIYNYIPSDCFIEYADFESIDDLVEYLMGITAYEYNAYIQSICDYLNKDLTSFLGSQIKMVANISKLMPDRFRPSLNSRLSMFYRVYVFERIKVVKKQFERKRNE